ncbi:MAG: protoporphyrinogen/coproporphyrinogen oxidase [Myxococcota bacterium]
MSAATQRSVIVVGAGLAGLVAAWRLSRQGFQVAVLDRCERSRLGGRAGAERREGFALEPVPPVLSAGDRRLLAWISDVGMQDDLLPLRPLMTQLVHLGSPRDAEVRGLSDVRRLPGVSLRQALRLVRLPRLLRRYGDAIDPARPERAADLDDRSLRDFGTLYFGGKVFDAWMAPLVTSGSLGDPREMSRVQFLHHVRRYGTERPGLPRGSLFDVIERAASELNVRTRVEVVGTAPREGGGVRVVLGDGRQVGADAVVLAVPAHEALRLGGPLLSPAERDGLSAVRYAPGITVAAALCRPPSARPVRLLVPRSEDSPIECATLEAGLPAARAPEGLGLALVRATPGFAAAHLDAPAEAVEKDLLGALDVLRPGIQRSVEFSRVLRTAHAAPRFDVGRYREIARFERVQRDLRAGGRRLYFAGDYLQHPSFEGAVVSAERTADAVQEDLR